MSAVKSTPATAKAEATPEDEAAKAAKAAARTAKAKADKAAAVLLAASKAVAIPAGVANEYEAKSGRGGVAVKADTGEAMWNGYLAIMAGAGEEPVSLGHDEVFAKVAKAFGWPSGQVTIAAGVTRGRSTLAEDLDCYRFRQFEDEAAANLAAGKAGKDGDKYGSGVGAMLREMRRLGGIGPSNNTGGVVGKLGKALRGGQDMAHAIASSGDASKAKVAVTDGGDVAELLFDNAALIAAATPEALAKAAAILMAAAKAAKDEVPAPAESPADVAEVVAEVAAPVAEVPDNLAAIIAAAVAAAMANVKA